MDFVNTVKPQLSDLDTIGEVGYVTGMTNIIVNNLNLLDVTKRPVHCTDKKREILYVKDENKWARESDGNPKIKQMIHQLSHKNINLIPKWKERHPECSVVTSNDSNTYQTIIIETMGGAQVICGASTDQVSEEKIIKNITKELSLEK